ncbi:MAG: hypothetical protein HY815_07055 [Candidatus Riflebacteria bacterium]|nr:hypothetical protein [Candidatus Riflebacteria bacterium]
MQKTFALSMTFLFLVCLALAPAWVQAVDPSTGAEQGAAPSAQDLSQAYPGSLQIAEARRRPVALGDLKQSNRLRRLESEAASTVNNNNIFKTASTVNNNNIFKTASTVNNNNVFRTASTVNNNNVFRTASTVNNNNVFKSASTVNNNNIFKPSQPGNLKELNSSLR